VAVEAGTGARALRYVEEYGVEYPVLLDADNTLAEIFGFKAIPNGVLLDEGGRLLWAEFSHCNVEDKNQIEGLKEAIQVGQSAEAVTAAEEEGELGKALRQAAKALYNLGQEFLVKGNTQKAIEAWQEALRYEPDSYLIRKQIWALRNPERFHPTVDYDWQRQQLERETQDERPF